MSSWLLIVLVLVAVLVLIVRRLRGQPLVARDLLGAPVVLVCIGFYSVVKLDGLDGTDVLWVVVGAAVGLGFGVLRGRTVRVYPRDGVLWFRYTGATFAVWVVAAVVNVGVGALAAVCGAQPEARPMTLSIGVSLLGEALVVGRRALATGTPFAPDGVRVFTG